MMTEAAPAPGASRKVRRAAQATRLRRLRIPTIVLLFALSLLPGVSLPSAPALEPEPPQPDSPGKPLDQALPFATIDSGSNSGVSTRQGASIRDQAEWLSLWRRHSSNQHPSPPAPAVDFLSEMVVAVFSGERHSGGYAIRIDRIARADKKLVVMVSESNPAPGEMNMMRLTRPYHMVRLAKSSLPVVFEGL